MSLLVTKAMGAQYGSGTVKGLVGLFKELLGRQTLLLQPLETNDFTVPLLAAVVVGR
jgi:hypothetical protein